MKAFRYNEETGKYETDAGRSPNRRAKRPKVDAAPVPSPPTKVYNTRKTWDQELKAKVIGELKAGKKPARQIADETGVPYATVRGWKMALNNEKGP